MLPRVRDTFALQLLRPPGPMMQGSEPIFARVMDSCFGLLGRVLARNPLVFILVGLLLTAAVSVGMLKARVSFDLKTEWTAPNSIWVSYEHLFESHFGRFFRHTDIFTLAAEQGNDDVVRPEILQELFDLEYALNNIEARSTNQSETRRAKLAELCLRPSSGAACFITSPLWHWNYNATLMWQDQSIRTTLGRTGFSHPLGFNIQPESILGGADVQYSNVRYAKLFRTTILFNNSDWAAQYLPDYDRQLRHNVRTFNNNASKNALFYSFDDDSIANSVSSALGSDILIIMAGFIVIYVFVAITLGSTLPWVSAHSCSFRAVHSKIGLGTFGFVIIGMVFLVVESIASVTGIITSAITLQVLPVLLLGVGIDSIYVLTHTYWAKASPFSNRAQLEAALESTLQMVGPSMLMSTVATTGFFIPVLTIDIPVISSLAAQVIIAVWANLLLQLLIFAPCIVLDARRIVSGRMDVLCCFRLKVDYEDEDYDVGNEQEDSEIPIVLPDFTKDTRTRSTTEEESLSLTPLDGSSDSSPGSPNAFAVASPIGFDHNKMEQELQKQKTGAAQSQRIKRSASQREIAWLSRAFRSIPARATVIAFFVGLFVVSAVACTYLKVGLEISTLIPEHSEAYQPYQLMTNNFNASTPFFLLVSAGSPGEEGTLDYSDPAVPLALLELKRKIEQSINTGTITYWYGDMISWVGWLSSHAGEYAANNRTVPPSKFIPWLQEFLSGLGSTHAMSIRQPLGNVGSRFPATMMMGSVLHTRGLRDILLSFRAMDEVIKNFTANSPPLSSATIVPYSPVFFALGQVDSFSTDAVRVIAGSLVVSIIVPIIFVHNVIAAVISVITMTLLVVSAFAAHIVLGLEMNGMSIVNVAIGLTLGSEYLSYVFRAYFIPIPDDVTLGGKSSASRTASTLSFIGSMLLLSILSSVLGMIVLLFTGYKLIRIYFGAMWICMIVLGALFSIVFAPIILSLTEKFLAPRKVDSSPQKSG